MTAATANGSTNRASRIGRKPVLSLRQCEVAWREFDTGNRDEDVRAVKEFEVSLHQEWPPALSKI